ncbi:MAG: hypothetical protein AB7P76_02080 [Candidatus Melainabacteria bacterium]
MSDPSRTIAQQSAAKLLQACLFAFLLLLVTACTGLLASLPAAQAEAGDAPLVFSIQPTEHIYSAREGLQVQFTFRAVRETKFCYEKDILSNLQLRVRKSGKDLALAPLVVRSRPTLFSDSVRVAWLQPGETKTFRASLKRYHFANGEGWTPGEYSISAVFNLCEQTEGLYVDPLGPETPVPSHSPGWFMIMS